MADDASNEVPGATPFAAEWLEVCYPVFVHFASTPSAVFYHHHQKDGGYAFFTQQAQLT